MTYAYPANCNSSDGSAKATASGGAGGFNYFWSEGSLQFSVSGLQAGNYFVTVTDANGCTISKSITISAAGSPTVSVSADVSISQGESTTLFSNAYSLLPVVYLWNPPTGLNCATCADPKASPLQTTIYCVTVSDSLGCSDSSCVTVTVETKCGELFVPTAFSPNNDNSNDCFRIYGTAGCFKSFYLAVYDRWGEKVFTTNNIADCWNGFYKGRELSTGIFVYLLEATTVKGEEINRQGNISLIR